MREINVSTKTTGTPTIANTQMADSIISLGKNITNVGKKTLSYNAKATLAQTRSQVSKYGTSQGAEWDAFNAEQSGNFDAEVHTTGADALYNKQRDMLENNKELTTQARETLISNLDGNTASSIKIFEGNEANARNKNTLQNIDDEVDFLVRTGDAEGAKGVITMAIDSGVISATAEKSMHREIDVGVDFANTSDLIQKFVSGEVTPTDGDSYTALAKISKNVYGNKEYSSTQQSALQREVTSGLKALANSQSGYIKVLDVKVTGNRLARTDVDKIQNPAIRAIYEEKLINQQLKDTGTSAGDKHLGKMIDSTVGRYDFDGAQDLVDDIKDENIKQEQQSILDTAKFKYDLEVTGAGGKASASTTKQKYTEWVPQFSTKKSKDFKVKQGEMYSGIQTTMNLLKTSGASYSISDIVRDNNHPRVISGKEAIGEISHYINQLPSGKQRDAMIKELNTIMDENPQFNWEIDTANNVNIKPELIKPFEVINNTFDTGDGLSTTQRNGVYNDAIVYITSMYNVDPDGFQKNKETIIKDALKPYHSIRSDISFVESLKQTTGTINTNTTTVIDFSTLK